MKFKLLVNAGIALTGVLACMPISGCSGSNLAGAMGPANINSGVSASGLREMLTHPRPATVIYRDNINQLSKLKQRGPQFLQAFRRATGDSTASASLMTYGALLSTSHFARILQISPNRVVEVYRGALKKPTLLLRFAASSGTYTEIRDAELGKLFTAHIEGKGRSSRHGSMSSHVVDAALSSGFMEVSYLHNFHHSGGYKGPVPNFSYATNGPAQMFYGYAALANSVNNNNLAVTPIDELNLGYNLGPININGTSIGKTDETGPLVIDERIYGFATYSATIYSYSVTRDGSDHFWLTKRETSDPSYTDIYFDATVEVQGIKVDAETTNGSGAIWDESNFGLWGSACLKTGCSSTAPSNFDHYPNPFVAYNVYAGLDTNDLPIVWPSGLTPQVVPPQGDSSPTMSYTDPQGVPTVTLNGL